MFYIWIISLIFYRYSFFAFSPSDLSPPYWINMGAMAISTLAGARMVENPPDAPFLASLLRYIKGFTVFYWATGTWWIPMLLVTAPRIKAHNIDLDTVRGALLAEFAPRRAGFHISILTLERGGTNATGKRDRRGWR